MNKDFPAEMNCCSVIICCMQTEPVHKVKTFTDRLLVLSRRWSLYIHPAPRTSSPSPGHASHFCKRTTTIPCTLSVCFSSDGVHAHGTRLTWAASAIPPASYVHQRLSDQSCFPFPDTEPRTGAARTQWARHRWLEGTGSILGGTKRDTLTQEREDG